MEKRLLGETKKWFCRSCDVDFRDKTDCKRHIESKHIHCEFVCPLCHKSHKSRQTYARHMKKEHGQMGSEDDFL